MQTIIGLAAGSKLASIWQALKSGSAFLVVGALEIAGCFGLALVVKPDFNWIGFSTALAVPTAALFGGGAWKAHVDTRNGSNGLDSPSSSSAGSAS